MGDLQRESDGQRIRRFRHRAGLNQTQLGQRIGRTQGWVSMLENDQVVLDSISLVTTLAKALKVDPNELLTRPVRLGRNPVEDRGHASIGEIRRQAMRLDLAPDWDAPIRSVGELTAVVAAMTVLRQKAAYLKLAEMIPAVLAELHAAVHTTTGAARERCFGLLSIVYRASDAVAYRLGYGDLSVLLVDKARWTASCSGDPYLVAVGDYLRVRQLWMSASWSDALCVLDQTATSLGEAYRRGEPRAVAVCGAIQLRAAITAARDLDADEAYARLGLAHEALGRLSAADRAADPDKLVFTSGNVAIHEVSVAVELGDGAEAVMRGAGLRLSADLPRSRVGHHYLDMARGWLWCGDRARSLAVLEKAERTTPALVRNHPLAHKTVRALLNAEHRTYKDRLRRLAVRMNAL
ncbi:helix-turn-helix domain-containing protein [Actinocorallia populi]|uniref:helix-turn-helix domain-containing protein n=1 Tax=Actinocorallia populi TaxID=2079200 RepID=UPI000D08E1CE|nr:helix-turn-helix transcriptional regulator [Actinocorallia populi]